MFYSHAMPLIVLYCTERSRTPLLLQGYCSPQLPLPHKFCLLPRKRVRHRGGFVVLQGWMERGCILHSIVSEAGGMGYCPHGWLQSRMPVGVPVRPPSSLLSTLVVSESSLHDFCLVLRQRPCRNDFIPYVREMN
jgi:hypothetical protein